MHNLAETYRQQGKIDRRGKDARGSVGEEKADLGRRSSVHARRACTTSHETYRQQGKMTEAAKMHEEVLAKTKADLGRRSSGHAHEHAQPRRDVPTAREN